MANSADPDQLASSEANLKKPTDLDLHCLLGQDVSRFSMRRVNYHLVMTEILISEHKPPQHHYNKTAELLLFKQLVIGKEVCNKISTPDKFSWR